MRQSIQKLYGIDPKEFKTDCIEQFFTRRIEALRQRQREVSAGMGSADSYEELSALSFEYKYIVKALTANTQDYEEIFG